MEDDLRAAAERLEDLLAEEQPTIGGRELAICRTKAQELRIWLREYRRVQNGGAR